MKSDWMRVGALSEEGNLHTEARTQGRRRVRAEIGVPCLQAKERQGCRQLHRAKKKAWNRSCPGTSRSSQPCRRLGFRLLASRTGRVNFCCFRPLSLQSFVKAALGNCYRWGRSKKRWLACCKSQRQPQTHALISRSLSGSDGSTCSPLGSLRIFLSSEPKEGAWESEWDPEADTQLSRKGHVFPSQRAVLILLA